MESVDVCIVGAGGAGMSAALNAAEYGCSVLILEAASEPGGSTALSNGVIYAGGTSVQQEAGVSDSLTATYERYCDVNRWAIEPAIARAFVEGAADAVEWFKAQGVQFSLLPPNQTESVQRSHMAEEFGAQLAEVLLRNVTQAGIEIRTQCRVEELLQDDRGAITGLRVGGDEIRAGAVIIATGGFGRSREMIEQYLPSVARQGDSVWSISAPTCVGDGLHLGQMAGGQIAGADRALAMLTPGFSEVFDGILGVWLMLVNRSGQRFVDETATYSVLARRVVDQEGSSAFAVFDEATKIWANPTRLGLFDLPSPNWNSEVIEAQVAQGRVAKADTVAELANLVGVDPKGLETAVRHLNLDAQAGVDSHFAKDGQWLRSVSEPPFYAAEVRPAMIALTACGLAVDSKARALTPSGEVIEGLYAAGETTAGVMGPQYAGSGNSLANALSFGRVAGTSAGELLRGSGSGR